MCHVVVPPVAVVVLPVALLTLAVVVSPIVVVFVVAAAFVVVVVVVVAIYHPPLVVITEVAASEEGAGAAVGVDVPYQPLVVLEMVRRPRGLSRSNILGRETPHDVHDRHLNEDRMILPPAERSRVFDEEC
jgi:hypothetical protein